jgi:hypothetical protein
MPIRSIIAYIYITASVRKKLYFVHIIYIHIYMFIYNFVKQYDFFNFNSESKCIESG